MNEPSEVWDAVVIGAGPAGAVTACLLARRGLRVALVERFRFPRPKVCGGCLNLRGQTVLEACGLGDAVRASAGEPLSKLIFRRRRRRVVLDGRWGAAIDRARFDAALVEAARNAGALFRDGVAARVSPVGSNGTRHVVLERQRTVVDALAARIVIAADGLGSPSLRDLPEFAQVVSATSRVGFGFLSLPTSRGDAGNYPGGAFQMGVADDGYFGVARLHDDRLCVGAAVDPRAVAGGASPARWLVGALAEAGFPPIDGLETAEIKGTLPLTRRAACAAANRIFVVGDAAGYVEPATGEGMASALASAARLAPIAVEACRQWRPELAIAWKRELHRSTIRRQRTVRLLAAAFRRPRRADWLFAAAVAWPGAARVLAQKLNQEQLPSGIAA